jgi:hypothetical protein
MRSSGVVNTGPSWCKTMLVLRKAWRRCRSRQNTRSGPEPGTWIDRSRCVSETYPALGGSMGTSSRRNRNSNASENAYGWQSRMAQPAIWNLRQNQVREIRNADRPEDPERPKTFKEASRRIVLRHSDAGTLISGSSRIEGSA